jgi:hypothetical protein
MNEEILLARREQVASTKAYTRSEGTEKRMKRINWKEESNPSINRSAQSIQPLPGRNKAPQHIRGEGTDCCAITNTGIQPQPH